jgi:organic radical activating enzyme
MISLPLVEFYITNVCNLTCRGCNRFNNYKFKGHQFWNDSADEIEAWSKRLDIEHITIIGGEPTLNPDLEQWVSNLRRLWPKAILMVQTNGTYYKPEYNEWSSIYEVAFAISVHDMSEIEKMKHTWKYGYFIQADVFRPAAVIERSGYHVHHSDISLAFNACDMKHDHTMFNGKLYKCPTMAVLPEFDQQFNLQLDQRQRNLLDAYSPLNSNCSNEELQSFIDDKNQPISQCEFCPSNITWHTALGDFKENLPTPTFAPINQNPLT